MSSKFQIIATIKSLEQASLVLSYPGTLLRINSSHMEIPNLVELITQITTKFPKAEIYVDLQGSKIRISREQPEFDLGKNQKIKLTINDPTPESKDIHIGNPSALELLSEGTIINNMAGNEKQVLVKNSNFTNNSSTKNGGAIICREGTIFEIKDSRFVNNN